MHHREYLPGILWHGAIEYAVLANNGPLPLDATAVGLGTRIGLDLGLGTILGTGVGLGTLLGLGVGMGPGTGILLRRRPLASVGARRRVVGCCHI